MHGMIPGLGPILQLIRSEARARRFFAVYAQSALGTGAAYVGLLLLAYERYRSPWAISLILMAELLPAMLLGPVFGAAADRWSRRMCLVVADVIRTAAFAGIVVVSSFEATLAFALLAGAGTGLFTPAALAALPTVVRREQLPAATSLYGTLTDIGWTAGPAVAALFLALGGPETIMAANSLTFALSSLVLVRTRFRPAPREESPLAEARPSLLREAREGVRATAGMPAIRLLLVASSAALFCGGLFNVGELVFAREELDADEVGYSVLVATFGLGFVVGSLSGARGGRADHLKRGYLFGLMSMSLGLIFSGVAPSFAVALAAFGIAGIGNGMVLVYERLLVQTSVADSLMARVFGIKDALTAWTFAIAFIAAGAIIEAIGVRTMFLAAGALSLLSWLCSALALRAYWPREPVLAGGSQLRANSRGVREQGADLVGDRHGWLTLLDDMDQRVYDP